VANKYSKYFYSSMSMTDLVSTYKAPQYTPAVPWTNIPTSLPELKQYTANGGLPTGLSRTEQRIISATNTFADAEAGLEIDWNRNSTKNAAPGSVIWSIQNLWTKGKFTKYLREQKFTSPALPPAISWKTHATLTTPSNVKLTGNLLSWNSTDTNVRFTIYAVPNASVGTPTAFTNVLNLIGISYSKQFDLTKYSGLFTTHKFAVAALDRYGNEFTPGYVVTSIVTPENKLIIHTNPNGIQVDLESYSSVKLFSINGVLLDNRVMEGTYTADLVHGVYILIINGKTHKIVF
jgi:hypothetical protein